MTASNSIRFAFNRITTDQFAIIEELYDPKKEISVDSSIRYNFSNNENIVDIQFTALFCQEEKVFIKLSVSCFFKIHEEDWKSIYNPSTHNYTLAADPARHLASLVTSITRGVLHAKTENTLFNQLILPPINLHETIKDAVEASGHPATIEKGK